MADHKMDSVKTLSGSPINTMLECTPSMNNNHRFVFYLRSHNSMKQYWKDPGLNFGRESLRERCIDNGRCDDVSSTEVASNTATHLVGRHVVFLQTLYSPALTFR